MSFLCKSASIVKSIMTLVFLSPAFAADTVIDLSEGLPKRAASPDCDFFANRISGVARDIRRLLVVEHGEILCEYQRNNVDDEDIFQLWSLTKPIFLMLMGMVIDSDEYDIDYNTTLGEVFPDDSGAWEMISDDFEVEFKKNVTMWELFVFRSGLSDGVTNMDLYLPENDPQLKFTWDRLGLIPDPRRIPDMVGTNLSESLYIPAIHPDDKSPWRYLVTSNILSYVMYEVTGMTPLEFAWKEVFPYIGITKAEWDTNADGMNPNFSSLRLTARGVAKLTMLFLQNGKSSPDKQLVSKEYVELATSRINWMEYNAFGRVENPYWEGFRWEEGTTPDGDMQYSAGGFMGQRARYSPVTGRIVVGQRSNTVTEMLLFGTGDGGNIDRFLTRAMSQNYTFEVYPPTESPSSGAFSTDRPSLSQMMGLSLWLMGLWL